MIEDLIRRVEKYTVPGEVDECWGWMASTLPSGRPRLAVRGTSITAARVIAAKMFKLPLHGSDPKTGERWCARHRCDNLRCVNPEHILAGTYRQNTADMWRRGRGCGGERHHGAKITAKTVRDICATYATSDMSQEQVGRLFGISQTHVGSIVRGEAWAHVM